MSGDFFVVSGRDEHGCFFKVIRAESEEDVEAWLTENYPFVEDYGIEPLSWWLVDITMSGEQHGVRRV